MTDVLLRPFVRLQIALPNCGSVRMARRRPSTQSCSASSRSPSSSRSSSSGTSCVSCSRTPQAASTQAARRERCRPSERDVPAERVRRPAGGRRIRSESAT